MALLIDVPTPAAGQSAPAVKAKRRVSRPVQFPIQLRVHIDPSMNAALGRISRRRKLAEGVIGRFALMEFLERNDLRYQQEIEADCA